MQRKRERDAQMHTQMANLEMGAVGDWGCLKRDTSERKYVGVFSIGVVKEMDTASKARPSASYTNAKTQSHCPHIFFVAV